MGDWGNWKLGNGPLVVDNIVLKKGFEKRVWSSKNWVINVDRVYVDRVVGRVVDRVGWVLDIPSSNRDGDRDGERGRFWQSCFSMVSNRE